MRHEDSKLRKCPVCGQEAPDLGLRDYYSWADKTSHGKIGATDVDRVKERRGQFLAWEFKPNKYVPPGQRIFFDALAGQPNWTVYLAIDKDVEKTGTCLVGRWVPGEGVKSWWTMTPDQMEELESMWFDEVEYQHQVSKKNSN